MAVVVDDARAAARRHTDAALVELLGAEDSGLPPERVRELVDAGLVPATALGGLTVPGSRHAVDPWLMVLIMASIAAAAAPEAVKRMRRWPLKKWASAVDAEIDDRIRRQVAAPAAPAISEAPLPEEARPPDRPVPPIVAAPPPEPPGLPDIPGEAEPPERPTAPSGGPALPIPAPPPYLLPEEREAWIQARTRGGDYMRGLGNVVDQDMQTLTREVWDGEQIVAEADREQRLAVREVVREEVAEAIARKQSARDLASDLGHRTGDWARDWERVARTELQWAYNEGVLISAVRTDGPGALIARIPEPGACEHCLRLFLDDDGKPKIFAASELVANGTNVGRKAGAWRATIGTVHPHCVLPDTAILTPRGGVPIQDVRPGDLVVAADGTVRRVEALWISAYVGELVVLETASGRILSVTPGHPIIGDDGALHDAGSVEPGAVVREVADGLAGRPLRDLHAEKRPSVLMQDHRLACILSGFARGGVPVSAVYLDGQLHVGEGDVYEASVDAIPWRRAEAAGLERFEDPALVLAADLPGGAVDLPDHYCVALAHSPDGVMGGRNRRGALLGRHLEPADLHRLAAGTLTHASLTQAFDDGPAVDTDDDSYLFHRAQLVKVHANDLGDIEGDALRHARFMPQRQSIVNVTRRGYRGLVYNLTIAGPGTYVANGIGVHNCRCDAQVLSPGMKFDADWGITT